MVVRVDISSLAINDGGGGGSGGVGGVSAAIWMCNGGKIVRRGESQKRGEEKGKRKEKNAAGHCMFFVRDFATPRL